MKMKRTAAAAVVAQEAEAEAVDGVYCPAHPGFPIESTYLASISN
jgi:hypothetical protein